MDRATEQQPLDLEIRIFARDAGLNGYPVEITLGDRERGKQEFPRGVLDAGILPWMSGANPVEDGQDLFDLFFQDKALRHAWAQASGQSPRRRIRLRIDPAAAELHTLPWELMRDRHHIFSAHADTPFSRYLPVALPWRGAAHERPLRILVVISNPGDLTSWYDLPPVDVAAERDLLESVLATFETGEVQADFLAAPVTPQRLEDALREGYHVLHYVGHGAFSARRGKAALYVQDEQGHAYRLLDDALAGMLARQGVQPWLVTLVACQSAARSTVDAFAGLGPELVSVGVPAVVAMQDVITVETARAFEAALYRRLLEHGCIDLAVNEARSTLFTAGRPDAGVPVLFMRLQSGRLWGRAGAEEGVEAALAATPELAPPPEPAGPPQVDGFVGREAELGLYAGKLSTTRL
ncbi:MAG: CHAT domain-containing protein, partial [Anaerolineae bacterium]|nr:CHAT domain-containing protein [Anaerolineae bacterium]